MLLPHHSVSHGLQDVLLRTAWLQVIHQGIGLVQVICGGIEGGREEGREIIIITGAMSRKVPPNPKSTPMRSIDFLVVGA